MTKSTTHIEDTNNSILTNLFGHQDENIKLLAKTTNTQINARGNQLQFEGAEQDIKYFVY